ncbi:MAG: GNAT family N-acetyltransferase [bacterium]|nr:GNAT family N-acetyltransferase [bacterium]
MGKDFKITGIKSAELDTFIDIVANSLGIPKEQWKIVRKYIEFNGISNIRVIRDGKNITGGLGLIPWGHFFGGRSVEAVGIGFVGIAPEYRRIGVASKLLSNMLNEMHDKKMPISTLFPASIPLYRKAGYECAMEKTRVKINLRDIDVRNMSLDVVPYKGLAALKEVYTKYARMQNGFIDRNELCWISNARGWGITGRTAYLIKRGKEVEGYIIFTPREEDKPIYIPDLVYLTRDAAERILTLLADHSSVFKMARFPGSCLDPILQHLKIQAYEFDKVYYCMLRIVHVEEALQARGYVSGVEAEIHFEISDDIIRSNNGRFILSVSDGRGKVKKGGDGKVRIDIRSLAQLYSGYYTPDQLKIAGKIEGSDSDLAELVPIFAGPRPWIRDDF